MERSLKELKKDFVILQKKYKLPKFEDLNLYFDIERVSEKETDFLLREVRRTIAEKIYLFLRFCEMVLNPSNAPLFMFSIIKNLSQSEKSKLEGLYKKLSKLDIEMMDLDLHYSEKSEAKFISDIYRNWKEINEDLSLIINSFKNSFDKSNDRGIKGYFG